MITAAINELNLAIRPDILNFLEAMTWVEEFSMSAVGNKYGDIYHTHLEWAKKSRMN